MPLPTLSKTWIFKTNQAIPAGADGTATFKNIFLNLKQSLTVASGWTDSTGAPVTNTHPWTVTSSSDGTTADLTDRWGAVANITSNGTNFSWIVLRQAAINPLFEIAFGLSASVNYSVDYLYASHGLGFSQTGLVTTAYPASLGDRGTFISATAIDAQSNAAHDLVLHYMMSTDGECTYVFGLYQNAIVLNWFLAKPKNPVTGWTAPAIVMTKAQAPTYANLNNATPIYGKAPGSNATFMAMYATTEGYSASALGQQQVTPNQLSGEYPLSPIGLACDAPGYRGRHGELFDLWFIPTNMKAGETLPSTGNRTFAVFPNILVPWNNSAVLTQ